MIEKECKEFVKTFFRLKMNQLIEKAFRVRQGDCKVFSSGRRGQRQDSGGNVLL